MRIILYVCSLLLLIGISFFLFSHDTFAAQTVNDRVEIDDIDIMSDVDVKNSLNSLSIPFIQNMGQVNSDVKYYVDTFAGHVFVTDDTIAYVVQSNDTSYMIQEHAKTFFSITGLDKSSTNVSSFIGDDPDKWQSVIPTYDGLNLGELWDGIDVSLHAYGNNVEKIFTVMPNHDVTQIQMSFDGITEIKKDMDGSLLLSDDGKDIMSLRAPIAFQNIDGEKIFVDVEYEIIDSTSYGFLVSPYNKDYILVIDPVIQATYLGGSGNDFSYSILIDSSGDVILIGDTASTNFPNTAGGADSSKNTNDDLIISKLSADLTSVIQSTYLGGTGAEFFAGGKLDSAGNVFVFARTSSTDFAGLASGADETHNGSNDFVISKLNNGLTSLIQSTYFGGTGNDIPRDMVIDSSDNIFVVGHTASTEIDNDDGGDGDNNGAITGGADDTHNGGNDMVIVKLTNDLQTFTQGTFFGGDGNDESGGIDIDSSDNIFIVGHTTSTELTITGLSDAAQGTHQGGVDDIVIAKFNNGLTTLMQSTFFGGDGDDDNSSIELDSSDNVFVVAETTSTSVNAISGGADESNDGGVDDIVIVKLTNDLQTFTQATFFGGSGNEDLNIADKIAFDSSDNVYVTGFTASTDIPGTEGAIQPLNAGGNADVFIAKLTNDLTTLTQSTYFGGSGTDEQSSIVFSGDNLYLFFTGDSNSNDISGTAGGFQESHQGGNELVIVLLSNNLLLVNPTTDSTTRGGGCSDCIPPTFGENKNGRLLVSDGFIFNGNATDVTDYHTEFPLITVITNQTNTVTVKIYENNGVNNIRLAQFGMGMPEVGDSLSNAQTLLEIWIVGGEIEEIIKIEKYNLVDILNATTSIVDCGYIGTENCLQITFEYVYRDQPKYNIMAINAMDNSRNGQTNYMNDGILVIGETLNEPLEQNVSVSNAGAHYPQNRGTTLLSLVDYKTDMWQDGYGYMWSGNNYGPYLVDKVPIPKKVQDKFSKWSGYNDRFHSEFKNYVEFQSKKAEKLVSEIYPVYEQYNDDFFNQKVIESDFTDGCYIGIKSVRESCVFDDTITYEIQRAELITLDYSNWKN